MLATRRFTSLMVLALLFAIGLVVLILLNSQPIGDLRLPHIVPAILPGLKPEHHSELNKVLGIPAARYDELRRAYEDDPVAQQQIDVYDPGTEYHVRLGEYVEALKKGDETKLAELEDWFKEHYPDIH